MSIAEPHQMPSWQQSLCSVWSRSIDLTWSRYLIVQESTAAAVLQRRLPRVPPHQASLWFAGGPAGASSKHSLAHHTVSVSVLPASLAQLQQQLGLIAAPAAPAGLRIISLPHSHMRHSTTKQLHASEPCLVAPLTPEP
jgi:hypothetical protein